MWTMPGVLAFLLAAGCAAAMGFAIQRGATCAVVAVEEVLSEGRVTRLAAMAEAALWVAGGLFLARALGLLTAVPAGSYALTGWTVLGGVLLGLGAYVNGACAFGSVARLGRGEWAFLATQAGFFLGCLTFGPVIGGAPAPLPQSSPVPQAPAAFALPVGALNAGLSGARRIGSVALEEWDAVLAVNLTAPMLLAQEAMRFWQAQRGGAIVNIGSRTWLSGAGPGYTASKAGLVGLTRSLAVQLGPLGITVNAVAPSYLGSAFNFAGNEEARRRAEQEHIRLGVLDRLGTAEDVAGAVAFLTSEDARFITGEVIHVCGGAQLAARPASAEITEGTS